MLIFKWIEIKNFMSVSNEWLRFNYQNGLTYVYGKNHDMSEDQSITDISNGSGKTVVLVDAPLFALFGKTQRKIKLSEIINLQNGCDCEVRLCLQKDDNEYIIERGLKPDKLTIIKNGETEAEEAKKRKVNKVIEEELLDGISFDVFKNLIVLNGTTSKHFFEYGKKEKREFINEVFRLGFLDYLQSDLTEEVKKKKTEIEKQEAQKTIKEEELERLKSFIEALENGETFDTSKEIKQKILEESQKITSLEDNIQKIETKFFSNSVEDFKRKVEIAKKKIEESNNEIIRLNSSIQPMKDQYAKLKEHYFQISQHSKCPECTQPISNELKNKLYQNLTFKESELKKEFEKINLKKTNLEEKIEKMNGWLNKSLKVLEDHSENNKLLERSKFLLTEYTKQKESYSQTPANLDKMQEEVKELEKNYQLFIKNIEDLTSEYNVYKISRDLVGSKNFYGFYISLFRKYLNTTINVYLEKIKSPHRIKFNNDLEADVFDGNLTVHNYNNLSTGERSKINIALLLSFFDVLNSFHRMETSLLILDEVLDTGLDSPSIYALHTILKEKISERPELGIYVVSHKQAESVFPDQEGVNKVVFLRRHGFTTISS